EFSLAGFVDLAILVVSRCTHFRNETARISRHDERPSVNRSEQLFSERLSSSLRRNLRMVSGLILFTYIGTHLLNHALGLISLDTAEAGMEIAGAVWDSRARTILLYGAFIIPFMLALIAVYERRTFRLPPL